MHSLKYRYIWIYLLRFNRNIMIWSKFIIYFLIRITYIPRQIICTYITTKPSAQNNRLVRSEISLTFIKKAEAINRINIRLIVLSNLFVASGFFTLNTPVGSLKLSNVERG
uniref:Uncharacterized protein n=1 Tax=Cacopsylla melanoneura TaxID=428564 RepID=A0A8D8X6I0_9HEMI